MRASGDWRSCLRMTRAISRALITQSVQCAQRQGTLHKGSISTDGPMSDD